MDNSSSEISLPGPKETGPVHRLLKNLIDGNAAPPLHFDLAKPSAYTYAPSKPFGYQGTIVAATRTEITAGKLREEHQISLVSQIDPATQEHRLRLLGSHSVLTKGARGIMMELDYRLEQSSSSTTTTELIGGFIYIDTQSTNPAYAAVIEFNTSGQVIDVLTTTEANAKRNSRPALRHAEQTLADASPSNKKAAQELIGSLVLEVSSQNPEQSQQLRQAVAQTLGLTANQLDGLHLNLQETFQAGIDSPFEARTDKAGGQVNIPPLVNKGQEPQSFYIS